MATSNGDTAQPRTYAVHLKKGEQPDVVDLLKKNYPSHYELAADLYLVKTTDLSQVIAEKLKIKGDNRLVTGLVFRLNTSYSGFYARSLWEWIDD